MSFYLLSLGVIVLTMRIPSNSVSAVHATQLLATKVGVVLLVLGGLYLAGIIALTRLRRRFKAQGQSVPQAALWRPPADRAAR